MVSPLGLLWGLPANLGACSTTVTWVKEEVWKFLGLRQTISKYPCDSTLKGYLLFGARSTIDWLTIYDEKPLCMTSPKRGKKIFWDLLYCYRSSFLYYLPNRTRMAEVAIRSCWAFYFSENKTFRFITLLALVVITNHQINRGLLNLLYTVTALAAFPST